MNKRRGSLLPLSCVYTCPKLEPLDTRVQPLHEARLFSRSRILFDEFSLNSSVKGFYRGQHRGGCRVFFGGDVSARGLHKPLHGIFLCAIHDCSFAALAQRLFCVLLIWHRKRVLEITNVLYHSF